MILTDRTGIMRFASRHLLLYSRFLGGGFQREGIDTENSNRLLFPGMLLIVPTP